MVRTAVVGAGGIAHFHADAYQALPGSKFCAVCAPSEVSVSRFTAQYPICGYHDLKSMLCGSAPTVVSICTPHPLHAAQAVMAMEAGCHVLVEKPMAMSVAECDVMLAAARSNGVQLGVISQRRMLQPCIRMKRAIEDHKIGRPILAEATLLGWRGADYYNSAAWRGTVNGEGGGVLINQAVHTLDLLLWFLEGDEVTDIYAVCDNFNHPYIEVEDTAAAVVRFCSGAIAVITASNSQDPALYGRIHIHGSNGASVGVQTDGGPMFLPGRSQMAEAPYNDLWTVAGEVEQVDRWRQEDEATFEKVDTSYYHRLQISQFLQAVQGDGTFPVDGESGKRVVALIESLYRSAARNGFTPLLDRYGR